MSLSSLPSELVSLIAESLPRADQARLSLASNQVRSSVQPVLYRNVQFDVDTFHDAELELFEDGCRRLGQAVESLADDPARCRFIRRFASKDHQAWLDREDLAQCVVRILLQATRVEQVDFLQTDDEWVTQLDWSPYYYIAPVWRVLPRLPSLRRLTNEVGPVDVLHLESLENLVELDMRTHIIDERAEGTLPASLEVLHLADVRNMTNGWFRPSLFSHLRSLSLFNIDDNAVEVIWNAVVAYAATSRPSTLKRLRLDLHALDDHVEDPMDWLDDSDTMEAERTLLLRSLRSFEPLAASVTHLEILSTPEQDWRSDTTCLTAVVLDAISSSFVHLERLELFFGGTCHALCQFLPTHPHLMGVILRALGKCQTLRHLETNMLFQNAASLRTYESSNERYTAAIDSALAPTAQVLLRTVPSLQSVILSQDPTQEPALVWARGETGEGRESSLEELGIVVA
ncbi:hypothetical protein DMC30DRAFT_103429 [Rhodotorula diobovata]|uniref:F-box domain-containing protein n=1 Tax=Rhodotorula diobovata TaxID=5288 RepID=A0A5C5FMR2_9BASI|nr:hypothetical protein DMC30DRAFT_103429 [Rhodotorula diobovata]